MTTVATPPLLIFAALLLLLPPPPITATHHHLSPNPHPWPEIFTIDCLTFPSPTASLAAKSFYSWPQRANRIDHAAGSFECTRFYNTTSACTLLFTATQMYGLFDGGCCLDSPVGTLPPNWGDGSLFVGYSDVLGVNSSHWNSTDPEHTFDVQALPPFLPTRFGFPHAAQDLFFNVSTVSYSAIPDSVFALPSSCLPPSVKPCQSAQRHWQQRHMSSSGT
jgi:hypothetical protein